MDGLAYLIMQISTIVIAVGTVATSVFIGHVWRKQKKEY